MSDSQAWQAYKAGARGLNGDGNFGEWRRRADYISRIYTEAQSFPSDLFPDSHDTSFGSLGPNDNDSVAGRVWQNPIIRAGICQYSTLNSLTNILRINKTSFDTAVPFLWGDRGQERGLVYSDSHWHRAIGNGVGYNEKAIKKQLKAVTCPDRYLAYCRFIHTILAHEVDSLAGVPPWIHRYPSLRRINFYEEEGNTIATGEDGHVFDSVQWSGRGLDMAAKVNISYGHDLASLARKAASKGSNEFEILPSYWKTTICYSGDYSIEDADNIDSLKTIIQKGCELQSLTIFIDRLGSPELEQTMEVISESPLRVHALYVYALETPSGNQPLIESHKGRFDLQQMAKIISTDAAYSSLCVDMRIPCDIESALQCIAACRESLVHRIELGLQVYVGDDWTGSDEYAKFNIHAMAASTHTSPSPLSVTITVIDNYHVGSSPIRRIQRANEDYQWITRLARACVTAGGTSTSYDVHVRCIIDDPKIIDLEHSDEHERVNELFIKQIPRHFADTIRGIITEVEGHAKPGWRRI